MLQPKPLVSINLVAYNAQAYLEACLASVSRQTYDNIELLIIDNFSLDETAKLIRKAKEKSPSIQVIFNHKNLGFSQAHNMGIEKTKGALICCLNQDIILDKDFIKQAVEVFEKEQVAAVQGKLLRLRKKVIDTTGLVMLKNRRIIARGQGQIDKGQYERKEEVFGADGAAPVYRRQALEDVKINNEYYDQDFFMYKEDVDLAWRLRLFGWQTIYQPKAIAWHDRTSGDSAAINYFGIIKERLKINQFAKYLSFKNQRLMQIKNEQGWLLLRHLLWFLPKEIGAWIYVILFERYTWRAIRDLFRQAPFAFKKRKIIMARKKASLSQMARWFK